MQGERARQAGGSLRGALTRNDSAGLVRMRGSRMPRGSSMARRDVATLPWGSRVKFYGCTMSRPASFIKILAIELSSAGGVHVPADRGPGPQGTSPILGARTDHKDRTTWASVAREGNAGNVRFRESEEGAERPAPRASPSVKGVKVPARARTWRVGEVDGLVLVHRRVSQTRHVAGPQARTAEQSARVGKPSK